MSYTLKSLAALAICFAPCAFTQSGVVGVKTPNGQIRFEALEQFLIDGSHRVRLMPAATQHVTPEDAKHFQREELAQIGIIRSDSAHRLIRLDEAGHPSDVILSDSFSPKIPMEAAAAQGYLSIEVYQSKKARTAELILPGEFFIFVSGAEPERLALNLLNRSNVFVNFDEQLAAMEGFVASFPDSPLKGEFRSQLQDRMANALAAFDNRGSYNDLLLTRRYIELARRTFPGDAALGQLSTRVLNLIQTVDATRLTLHSLAASGEWDRLLDAYLSFEHYQWSFPDTMALRQTALEESARLHAHRGALLAERHVTGDALQELNLAARRDPENHEIAKLVESTRVLGSLTDANAARHAALPAGSPEELRFKRSLHDAESALQDKDLAKATAAIQLAQTENKEAPDILLLQARLLAARDRNSEALPLLDTYDRTVADPAARELGNTARNDILYDLEKKRTALRQQLQKLQQAGEYSKLRAAAAQALTLDPDDDDFLYYSGTVAALFRDPTAKERLDRYLVRSNSLRGDLQARERAYRIRAMIDAPKLPQPAGTPNWLSGRPLAEELYYCPVSGAFQLPIDGVNGYKLKMSFQWDRTHLNAITTTFDDEKGSQNYRSLGGPGESQGNFFFGYVGNDPQVQGVYTRRFDSPVTLPELRVAHEAPNPPHLVDEHGVPRLLFQDSPQFNTAILAVLEGPVATGIAGNSFFNPFIWDGLHYFTLYYDGRGRLSSAREWNSDNLVRFTWSGDRLTEIRAFLKESPAPYYQRTISYSGAMITGESYNQGSKTGQIKYVYSGKVLQQVKVEDGGVHDGKTWTVRMH